MYEIRCTALWNLRYCSKLHVIAKGIGLMREEFEDAIVEIINLEGDVITDSGCNMGGTEELPQDPI